MKTNEFWNDRLIFKTYSGSISYGLNTPSSDVDTRGICIEPMDYLLGLKQFEQHESKATDETIFSLKKFVRLALDNNPNIIDTLFVADEHIIFINDCGRELRSIKDNFISKKVYQTYGGYAISQLKKMTTIDKNAIGKRKDSIDKFGYDTKNALHLLRLMTMAIEILMGNGVKVRRPDAEFLLKVKRGEFSLTDIINFYEEFNAMLNEAYISSKLPEQPDYDSIHKWLVDVTKRSLDWNGNN